MSFSEDLTNRILILDGAMGSALQEAEEAMRSGRPADSGRSPQERILQAYVDAGADIITTDSFNANRLITRDADKAAQMAFEAAALARKVADRAGRKVYVAGSVSPTGKSLSMPNDASDPAVRPASFDELRDAFKEQTAALTDGGADLILLETWFDALNAKAAISALEELGNTLPVIISTTVSDRSGRTITGQTIEAFYTSVRHCPNLAAFGINCALGAEAMTHIVSDIAQFSRHPLIFYPNAGIPDEFGRYNDSPATIAKVMSSLADKGLLNIAGGCCGTTPAHIAAIREALEGKAPRIPGEGKSGLTVSGLETVRIDRSQNFTNVGERTNVTGSRKFARLISEGSYAEALEVARAQIEGGAGIIDINMDDPMLDSKMQMRTFLRHISGEPDIAKAALMIDSSHWETIVEGLQNAQGKCIVNSISLKDGEEEFLRRAKTIKGYGAAMVVMAFDEQGQALDFARKVEICSRSYNLLTRKAGIAPEDIIFDCNILTIGTGIPEHARFGVDFIEAVRWIKANLDGALTSGGLSNLSFAFRGNNAVREAMHSVFLYHAVNAGLDMAIVNPQMLQIYDSIEPGLRSCIEDVIFDRDKEATNRLVEMAGSISESAGKEGQKAESEKKDPAERLSDAVVKGSSSTIASDAVECCKLYGDAVKVIEGPLMDGMTRVGELFSEGKMFLPQVVKSAKTMRDAVDALKPFMESGSGTVSGKPKFVIATVQGDVHDIGKNITSIILQCSGFEVIDLGVMVSADTILGKAREVGADIIGVSGLITPSLHRMEELCRMMAEQGMDTPLFVGGAAASAVHTASRLHPLYGNVHYGADASATAVMAKRFMQDPDAFLRSEEDRYAGIRNLQIKGRKTQHVAIGEGFLEGSIFKDIPLTLIKASECLEDFDWKTFFAVCRAGAGAESLKEEAAALMDKGELSAMVCARFFDCHREGDDIVGQGFWLPMLRDGVSLADFFPASGSSQLGVFAIRTQGGEDRDILAHAVKAALAETISLRLSAELSGMLPEGMRLIMPAAGYACFPDHSMKRDLLSLLPEGLGISLTDSCAMIPEESICGLIIAHADAAYNDIRTVEKSSLEEYAGKRGFSEEEKGLFLGQFA